jgi:hypothetical protein
MPKGLAAVVALVSAMLVLAISIAPPAAAQTGLSDDLTAQSPRARGKLAREAARAAETFARTAATYADIVNLSLTDRAGAVRVNLASARGELVRLRPYASGEAVAALEGRLAEMETAEASGNLPATALAAAEAFKVVIMAMNPQMRRLPLEVSLHTYLAFKLVSLASAAEPDWTAIAQTAKESEKSWIGLRRMVRDTNLRVLLSEVQSGLREAVARNDLASVRFAARLQVGSTAVLRDFFNRMMQAMARGRGGDMSQLSR